ncbi:DUF881 domain-containing protein [Dermacoccus abyssi]|uniref:DUF881 domain-containing protein n=1 Tax=Dermacoccus abyssi TaxID=322596 RepID=UPI0021A46336|nr:DUF881 domain-containing protein [Dermacoccus abyssi]
MADSPSTPATDAPHDAPNEAPGVEQNEGVRMPSRRRVKPWQVAVPIVTLVAGLMFAVSSRAAHGTDLRSGNTQLSDVVAGADRRVKEKQQSVASLRRQVEQAQSAAAKKDGPAAQASKINAQASKEEDPAGLAPLTGQAITVTLDDSKKSVDQLPEDGTPDWLVVHQQDVQAVVNALWRAGARGMMLMDQRVVSTSAVRCVGNTLILQGRVYSPPFTIKAIGDPVKLKAALDDDDAVKIYKQYVDLVGLGYDVKTEQNASFPAFTGSLSLKYARAQR